LWGGKRQHTQKRGKWAEKRQLNVLIRVQQKKKTKIGRENKTFGLMPPIQTAPKGHSCRAAVLLKSVTLPKGEPRRAPAAIAVDANSKLL